MRYTIIIKKIAKKFIIKLPKTERENILKAIYKLPTEGDIKRLKGKKNKELYRLRVSDYRIIYTVNNQELIVLVIDAGNRGDIYNKYK